MRRLLLVILSNLLISGCAGYTLVEPHRTTIGEAYSVVPQIAWNQGKGLNSFWTMGGWKGHNAVLWTMDGQSLQELWFVIAVEDGEPLGEAPTDTQNPIFQRNMNAIEIHELVSDTLGNRGAQKIETEYLKPFSFGDHQGFRFELSFLTANGLEKQALVVGSVIEDKLYLIVYSGTRAYYFPKYRTEVENLISSIKIP